MIKNLHSKVLLIMGSVRDGRRCPQITHWIFELAQGLSNYDYEIIDLKEWNLPADDEEQIPQTSSYAHEHTRRWSAKIASADGFIIISPQYNRGYPAPLKNALDHLYKEWNGKPLVIVTYGGHGGNKCAEQLRQVADGLKLRSVATMPAITIARATIERNAPSSVEDLKPFETSVVQALDELNTMLAS